ncbi:MAG: rod shape-determining protein MreC [Thermodesulfobacteria bacterium]|nr:rod shape-determining protein MreC [Thermodesulfobacteriota bacterium]
MKKKYKKFLIGSLIFFSIFGGFWFFLVKTNILNGLFGTLNSFFWKSGRSIGGDLREFFKDYFLLVNLKKENEVLRKEVLVLKAQLAKCQEALKLYAKVEKFYQVSKDIKGYKATARVIYNPLDPYSQIIYIDKGSNSNIKPQAPVFAVAFNKTVALVGQVVEVHNNWSKVILLTHPSFAADVRIVRTGDRGILKGTGQTTCIIEYLPSTASLKPGDQVITSGEDDLFPPDVLIGTVVSVRRDPVQAVFKIAEVKPAINIRDLQVVHVLVKNVRKIKR